MTQRLPILAPDHQLYSAVHWCCRCDETVSWGSSFSSTWGWNRAATSNSGVAISSCKRVPAQSYGSSFSRHHQL